MLLIDTFIAQSHISGVGLFTKNAIEPGTVISKFKPPLDVYFEVKIVEFYPELTKNFIKRQAFLLEKYNYYLLTGGNERFINHSNNNNLTMYADYQNYKSGEFNCIVAIVNIPSGNELTLDYKQFSEQQYQQVIEHIELRDSKTWPPRVQLK